MTHLTIKAVFLIGTLFCMSAWGNSVIDQKALSKKEFFANGFGLRASAATVISEQELETRLKKLVSQLDSSYPDETVTIHVRTTIANDLDSTKDLYVSFGNCSSTDAGLQVSYMKCTEEIQYKYVAILANPKGILNEFIAHFRILIPSEKSIVSVVSTQVMKTPLGVAVLKDVDLMNSMRDLYPSQQCKLLKQNGYKPKFSEDEKAMIAQCLNLN